MAAEAVAMAVVVQVVAVADWATAMAAARAATPDQPVA
jgi:hypothetical protein